MDGLYKRERRDTFDDDGWVPRPATSAGSTSYDQLHFTGRRTPMIKSGGANVSPAEVEAALGEVAGVRAAYVFAAPPVTGERTSQRWSSSTRTGAPGMDELLAAMRERSWPPTRCRARCGLVVEDEGASLADRQGRPCAPPRPVRSGRGLSEGRECSTRSAGDRSEEALQLARDVVATGLVDDLSHPAVSEFGRRGHVVRRRVPVRVIVGSMSMPATRAARSRPVRWTRCPSWVARCRSAAGRASTSSSQASPPGNSATAVAPLSLEDRVDRRRRRRGLRLEHPRRAEVLSVLQHGAELQEGMPAVSGCVRDRRGEDAVADGLCDGGALRSVCTDEDRNFDWSRRPETVGVEHLDGGALPLGDLAPQERRGAR